MTGETRAEIFQTLSNNNKISNFNSSFLFCLLIIPLALPFPVPTSFSFVPPSSPSCTFPSLLVQFHLMCCSVLGLPLLAFRSLSLSSCPFFLSPSAFLLPFSPFLSSQTCPALACFFLLVISILLSPSPSSLSICFVILFFFFVFCFVLFFFCFLLLSFRNTACGRRPRLEREKAAKGRAKLNENSRSMLFRMNITANAHRSKQKSTAKKDPLGEEIPEERGGFGDGSTIGAVIR